VAGLASDAEAGCSTLELDADELGPAGAELQPPAKRYQKDVASPAVRTQDSDVATPQTAPEVAIPTIMTASPTSSSQVDSDCVAILAARVPAARLDEKVTAEALKQRGVKVILAAR
jgi:hypothetical protein